MNLHCLMNPKNAFEFTDIGLSLENTLPTLLRLRSLASGFETFACRQKAKLSRLLTVFKKQPDIDSCIIWVNELYCQLSGYPLVSPFMWHTII
jgi:hypothetical protein